MTEIPYVFRSVYSIYAMPKTAARDIHGKYQSHGGWFWDNKGMGVRAGIFLI